MSRLTKRTTLCDKPAIAYRSTIIPEQGNGYWSALEKLAHYEDLEEAGRLIAGRPIDVDTVKGRTLYFIGANNIIFGVTEEAIVYILNQKLNHKFREGIYLTKAEAEAKLAEIQKGGE